MLITFEGIDGSGKTTHFKRATELLKEKGFDVESFREPGGTDFSENVRTLLLETNHEVSDISELLLFEAARADLFQRRMKPILDRKGIVILDRFFDSTVAYQGYGRGLSIEVINYLNNLVTGGVKPDITFYMRVPIEDCFRRMSKNRDRIENAEKSFFENVYRGFEENAKLHPDRVITIDATEPKDIVFETIKEHLRERGVLKKKDC
jgi:dTMP kinase